MTHNLLAVKFFVPKPRPGLIERPRLLDRFSAGLAGPLTLISAPAGFGKSTLLSAWLAQHSGEGEPAASAAVVCWLSLDAGDNTPSRFWTYLIAAIQAGVKKQPVNSGAALHQSLVLLLEFLQSDPPPAITAVLDELINAISEFPERILLIFDDYHLIQTPEIHEQMTYLLEHQPPGLHLVVSTRADPPFPITRLRARGQLSEFRAADLRFTASETEEFFKNLTGLVMPDEDITALQASTEGWAAGLQMAGLAFQALLAEDTASEAQAQHSRMREFIGTFSGKNLYILDYLTDEVFNRQPEAVQTFLLKTSILKEMNASLCEVVLQTEAENNEGNPPGDHEFPSQAKTILDYLDRSNLFIIRLDHERQWFRYHHLFADLLRARLEERWPASIAGLHRKASQWYAQNGSIDEAVQHALAAEDWGLAAMLMETHCRVYLERGQLATILRWIDRLPDIVLNSRPVLCAQVAEALAHAGQFQRVPPLLDAVDAALAAWDGQNKDATYTNSLTDRDLPRVRGIVTLLRGFGHILTGQPEQALCLANDALKNIPGLETRELAWLNWVTGYAYRSMGQLDRSIYFLEIALALSKESNTLWEDMSTDLGIVYRMRGKLALAVAVFEDALRQAEEQGIRNKGSLSRVEAFLSAALLDQNRLEEALQHAQNGMRYLQWWPSHNHITTVNIYLGQILLAIGKLDEAAEAVERAAQEQHKGQVMPTVLRLVEKVSVLLWLKRGNWSLLDQWLAQQDTTLPDYSSETRLYNEFVDTRFLTLARVWIAKGRKEAEPRWFAQAFELLSQVENPARRSHWVRALIEINLLQAVALYEMGKMGARGVESAMEPLTRSLRLGLPAGFTNFYLQEGAVVAELLQLWLKTAAAKPADEDLKPDMVNDLLDLFGIEQPDEPGAANRNLIEPLTEREQEVLQLLALGLSNKDMAERMVIAEGTVKTHVHNIIGKLGAQNRTHVLVRAKELDLL
jgi:LuxR family transcriptional regulator, maltose regulon positive regulatory protein